MSSTVRVPIRIPEDSEKMTNMVNWCANSFGAGPGRNAAWGWWWSSNLSITFSFDNETDVLLFLLRWK